MLGSFPRQLAISTGKRLCFIVFETLYIVQTLKAERLFVLERKNKILLAEVSSIKMTSVALGKKIREKHNTRLVLRQGAQVKH